MNLSNKKDLMDILTKDNCAFNLLNNVLNTGMKYLSGEMPIPDEFKMTTSMTNINTNFIKNVSSSVQNMYNQQLIKSSSLGCDMKSNDRSESLSNNDVHFDSQTRSPYLTFGDSTTRIPLKQPGKHVCTNPCTICGSEMKKSFPTGITRRGTQYGTTTYKPTSATKPKKYKIIEVDTMNESIKKNKEALENNEDAIYQVRKTTKQIPTQEHNEKFRQQFPEVFTKKLSVTLDTSELENEYEE